MFSLYIVVRESDLEELDRWVVSKIHQLSVINVGDVYVTNNQEVYAVVRTETVASVPNGRFTKLLYVETHICETEGKKEHKKLYLK